MKRKTTLADAVKAAGLARNLNQFRQGDVFIERVEQLTEGERQKEGRVILAHGEVTGHCHEVDQDQAEAWKLGEDTVGIQVKSATAVTHQEHSRIPLTKGNYRVVRQREYTPEEIRRVAD